MITKCGEGVKIYHKTGEIWENCDPWRKPGEGVEKQDSQFLQLNKASDQTVSL